MRPLPSEDNGRFEPVAEWAFDGRPLSVALKALTGLLENVRDFKNHVQSLLGNDKP
jgi:hypothetical protein